MKFLGLSPFTLIASILGLSISYQVFTNPRKELPSPKRKSNPRLGGWDSKRIAEYNRLTGSKLKHGVNYDPITLEDFKRKGSWATRHYKRKNGWQGLNTAPLVNEKGELLPFSTQAIVWGERPPKNRKEQKRLVKLGERLLKTYQKYKEMGYKNHDLVPVKVRKRFKKGIRK
jgi:hypothetical protein